MAWVSSAERKEFMQAKVQLVDAAVRKLPLLASIWPEVRPQVVTQILTVPPQKFPHTLWPALFLWLCRQPNNAPRLETALGAVKAHGGRTEFKQACSQLCLPAQPDQASSRVIELLMIARCLERRLPGEVELHPLVDPTRRKRADLATSVHGKKIYFEVTVLLERQADKDAMITTRSLERDGGRILAKLLDKVAPELDVGRSQLSTAHPNVIILAVGPVAGAYDEAFDWAFAALDDYPDRLRHVVSSRAKERERTLTEEEMDAVVAAFSRLSAVVVFADAAGTCSYWKPWRRTKPRCVLDEEEVRHIVTLFGGTPSGG